jgi:hypothetical protein
LSDLQAKLNKAQSTLSSRGSSVTATANAVLVDIVPNITQTGLVGTVDTKGKGAAGKNDGKKDDGVFDHIIRDR